MEKDFEQVRQEYVSKRAEIRANDYLTLEGKAAALKELAGNSMTTFKAMLEDAEAAGRDYRKALAALDTQAPAGPAMTERELLQERREVELLMGRLTAGGKDKLLSIAEEVAKRQPALFTVAYTQVKSIAEGYYPGPASNEDYDYFAGKEPDAAGQVDLDASKRAFIFSQLDRLYNEAAAATTSPEEKRRQQEMAVVEKLQAKNMLAEMRINRAIEQVKQDLTFDQFTGGMKGLL